MNNRVYTCYYCKKVIALPDNAENRCYQCGRELIDLCMDADSWQGLTFDVQQDILKKAYRYEEDWNNIREVKSTESNVHSSYYDYDDVNDNIKESNGLKIAVIVMTVVLIALAIILGTFYFKNQFSKIENIPNQSEEVETSSDSNSVLTTDIKPKHGHVNDNYLIDGLFPVAILDEGSITPLYIEGNDPFWVLGEAQSNNSEKFLLKIDQNGNLYDTIKYKEGDYLLDEKYVYDKESKTLYNRDGFDASNEFCEENEEIVFSYLDKTGYTIWVLRTEETYNSVDLTLIAKDFDGNIKASWDLRELQKLSDSAIWDGMSLNEIKYAGGSVYFFIYNSPIGNEGSLAIALNLENKAVYYDKIQYTFDIKYAKDFIADDKYVYLRYDDYSYSLWDIDGSPCSNTRENGDRILGYLGENCFLCTDDLGATYILNDSGDENEVTSAATFSRFRDGIAIVNLVNEKETCFNGLIDTNGTFLFDPVKGIGLVRVPNMSNYEYMYTNEDSTKTFVINKKGDSFELLENIDVYSGNNGIIEEGLSLNGSIGHLDLIGSDQNNSLEATSLIESDNDQLLQSVKQLADGDDLGEFIIEDFTGDGIQDIIAEAGRSENDQWTQYYIFSDGTNSYRFGEYTNSIHYETNIYALPVGKYKHFVTSNKWRAKALNGEMSHAAIYKIGTEIAIPLFDKEFCAITGIDDSRSIAFVSYHKEADPGENEIDRGILHVTDDKIEPFYNINGISMNYNNATVKPKSDPQNTWRGTEVQEVTANYGIHFYVPADWSIYSELSDDNIDGLDFSAIDDKGRSGWIISTSCYKYEGNSEPFDWGEGQWVFRIGNSGNEHYYICVAAGIEDDEPQYNPDYYFPELKKYTEKIGETAWVE